MFGSGNDNLFGILKQTRSHTFQNKMFCKAINFTHVPFLCKMKRETVLLSTYNAVFLKTRKINFHYTLFSGIFLFLLS